MSKLLDKVTKLIALSASSNENEARNTAYKACKLIREHNLVLSEPRAEWTPPWERDVRESVPPAPSGTETISRAVTSGQCAECHCTYWPGARIVRTRGKWVHLKCWRHS
jgi:hypothetical protein